MITEPGRMNTTWAFELEHLRHVVNHECARVHCAIRRGDPPPVLIVMRDQALDAIDAYEKARIEVLEAYENTLRSFIDVDGWTFRGTN